MSDTSIAFIGGSGLYNIEGISAIEKLNVNTPFGKPSSTITIGKLNNLKVAFLPRHGINHELNPSEIPTKANIYAMLYQRISIKPKEIIIGSIEG